MLLSLKNEVVSILVDGARKCVIEFEGVIIYYHKGLKFFALVCVPDQKSKTLAEVIAFVVRALANNGTRVVSVCSDNAKPNIKALDANTNSAQDLSGLFFIRQ